MEANNPSSMLYRKQEIRFIFTYQLPDSDNIISN